MRKMKNYKKIKISHEDSLEDKILNGKFKPIRQKNEITIIER